MNASEHRPEGEAVGDSWRKSRRSGADTACVEVAAVPGGTVVVRDSKDPGGPRLAVRAAAWTAFIQIARDTRI